MNEIRTGGAVGADGSRLRSPGQSGIGFCGGGDLSHHDVDGVFRKVAGERAAAIGGGICLIVPHAGEEGEHERGEQNEAAQNDDKGGACRRISFVTLAFCKRIEHGI